MLRKTEPQDLIKYGLIPEFVGRLPVMGVLDELDEAALIEILTKPRNAILKQYQRLFEYENVRLHFTQEAACAVAREALARKVGARGLAHDSRRADARSDVPPALATSACATSKSPRTWWSAAICRSACWKKPAERTAQSIVQEPLRPCVKGFAFALPRLTAKGIERAATVCNLPRPYAWRIC